MEKREIRVSNALPEGLGGTSGISKLRIEDGYSVTLCAETTAAGSVISFTEGVSAFCETV